MNKEKQSHFSGSAIDVFFRVERTEEKLHFRINIKDEKKWIFENIYCKKQFLNGERVCESMTKLKPHELEYYYIEPKN